MRTIYRIQAKEIGEVLLKRRKIAKALRWWLRENGYSYTSNYYFN
jgi:diadenosine tetraphosphate (Ap4A) HIT family hydrolase